MKFAPPDTCLEDYEKRRSAGSRDLGDVSRRIIFQEAADHEIRSARHLS